MYLGIEIGTHIARAAYLDGAGQPRLVTLPDGSQSLPTIARQTMRGLVTGAAALQSLAGERGLFP